METEKANELIPAISFIPDQSIYLAAPPEEFRDVTDIVVPGVKPYYMISNYGRLWSGYSNRFLANNVDSKGYLYKPLARYDGKMINCRIHRLVMMTFNYFPGCENVIINHIDGNKCNPAIWNLEWSDLSSNEKHAWDNDMRVHGKSKVSDDVARIVCNLLMEDKLNYSQIAELCNISYGDVSSIATRRTHMNISYEYNFPRKKGVISDDKVRNICTYFSTHPRNGKLKNDYCSEALLASNIEINASTLSVAERILYHQSFTSISKDYDF